ncbi:prion-inhibition and propagation-domain-containing protein [Mycena crocata]|nr:prion-inhibition and propagation-domain-containing protein [Mycena crocata]
MEVTLPVLGLLGQCYSGALQAYMLIQTAVDFPDTAAKLVIQLEVERGRLQLWGENSGADCDRLNPRLAPFEPLIVQILTKVQQLLTDSDKLTDSYGLVSSVDMDLGGIALAAQTDKRTTLIAQIKDALRSASAFGARQKKGGDIVASATAPVSRPVIDHHALLRKAYERIRWVVVSKARFETLISDLRHLTNNLNELLQESQLTNLSQQWHSIEVQTVARTDDPSALEILREATEGNDTCRGMYSMAGRKAIVVSTSEEEVSATHAGSFKILDKDEFDLPNDFSELFRCVAIHRPLRSSQRQKYVLIERKTYASDISPGDMTKLLFRLHNLANLVNSPPSEFLLCMGYWSEPSNNCWCVVYEFPLHGTTASPNKDLGTPISSQPLSLLQFVSSESFRPALEARLELASTLAGVFSRFYGSKWLHKGVRSDNIVFPLSGSGGVYDISCPIVAGFEYSRQSTEMESIDAMAAIRAHAIYRHPAYPGLATERYRMAYDIYSFGLVLAEIAWWTPLESFLRALLRKKGLARSTETEERFGMEEAIELRRAVITRARKELAFRVGSGYKEVVEWCLTRGDTEKAENDADLAVEFYEKVAVPLQNMSGWRSY